MVVTPHGGDPGRSISASKAIADAIEGRETSYRRLALKVGCDHAYLNNVVKGRQRSPRNIEFYLRLADALGLDPEIITEYRRLYVTDRMSSEPDIVDRVFSTVRASASESDARPAPPEDQVPHGDAAPETAASAGIRLDDEGYKVSLDGEPLDLTYMEYELLRYFITRPGRVLSREALLRAVWGYDFIGGMRTVDVHVRRLRAKLGSRHETVIETVRNVGYRFDPE